MIPDRDAPTLACMLSLRSPLMLATGGTMLTETDGFNIPILA